MRGYQSDTSIGDGSAMKNAKGSFLPAEAGVPGAGTGPPLPLGGAPLPLGTPLDCGTPPLTPLPAGAGGGPTTAGGGGGPITAGGGGVIEGKTAIGSC